MKDAIFIKRYMLFKFYEVAIYVLLYKKQQLAFTLEFMTGWRYGVINPISKGGFIMEPSKTLGEEFVRAEVVKLYSQLMTYIRRNVIDILHGGRYSKYSNERLTFMNHKVLKPDISQTTLDEIFSGIDDGILLINSLITFVRDGLSELECENIEERISEFKSELERFRSNR